MNTSDLHLSCVVPVYNSAPNLKAFVNLLIKELSEKNFSFEVVLVDDKSEDNSTETIYELITEHKNIIKRVFLARHKGQHYATLAGINAAAGDFIITIDDDGQYQPSYIDNLLKATESLPQSVIFGIPIKKTGVSKTRKFFSNMAYYFMVLITQRKNRYSSFRCIPRYIGRKILNSSFNYVNIEQIIRKINIQTHSIQVTHSPGLNKKSRYNMRKLISFVFLSILTYTWYFETVFLLSAFVILLFSFIAFKPSVFVFLSIVFIFLFILLVFLKNKLRMPVKFH